MNTRVHKFQVDKFFSVPILSPSTAEMTRLVAGSSVSGEREPGACCGVRWLALLRPRFCCTYTPQQPGTTHRARGVLFCTIIQTLETPFPQNLSYIYFLFFWAVNSNVSATVEFLVGFMDINSPFGISVLNSKKGAKMFQSKVVGEEGRILCL